MARDPAKRYASCQEFVRRLEEAVASSGDPHLAAVEGALALPIPTGFAVQTPPPSSRPRHSESAATLPDKPNWWRRLLSFFSFHKPK